MICNCIILARKNSRRIINKNLVNFKGKPLIYWTITKALKLKNIKRIILSSDSKKILSYSRKISDKILIDNRPSRLALNHTSSEKVLKYLIKKNNIKKDEYILLLQPTSPLRRLSDINNLLKIAKRKNLISLHSVSYYPGKKIIKDKIIIQNSILKNENKLSYNGSIYLFKASILVDKNTIYEKKQNVYLTPKKNSLDIDIYKDLIGYT